MENLIEKFFNKSVECFKVDYVFLGHTSQTVVHGTWGRLTDRAFAMLVTLTLKVARLISDYRDEEGRVETHVLGLSRADNDLVLFVDYFDGEESQPQAVILSYRLDSDLEMVSFDYGVMSGVCDVRDLFFDKIETYDFLLNQNDFSRWFDSSSQD